MRRLFFLLTAMVFLFSGCATTSTSTKSTRLPRETVRQQLGAHAELAMVLSTDEVVRRKLRQDVAGEDGVNPKYARKFNEMIATFDAEYVERILTEVLKDYFTEDEVITLSDHLASGDGQVAVPILADQLIDFKPKKPGPSPVVAKALGGFAKTEVGKKWVTLSSRIQSDFTFKVKKAAAKEGRRVLGLSEM